MSVDNVREKDLHKKCKAEWIYARFRLQLLKIKNGRLAGVY